MSVSNSSCLNANNILSEKGRQLLHRSSQGPTIVVVLQWQPSVPSGPRGSDRRGTTSRRRLQNFVVEACCFQGLAGRRVNSTAGCFLCPRGGKGNDLAKKLTLKIPPLTHAESVPLVGRSGLRRRAFERVGIITAFDSQSATRPEAQPLAGTNGRLAAAGGGLMQQSATGRGQD